MIYKWRWWLAGKLSDHDYKLLDLVKTKVQQTIANNLLLNNNIQLGIMFLNPKTKVITAYNNLSNIKAADIEYPEYYSTYNINMTNQTIITLTSIVCVWSCSSNSS